MLLTRSLSLALSASDAFASRTASPAVYGGRQGEQRGGVRGIHVISWLIELERQPHPQG